MNQSLQSNLSLIKDLVRFPSTDDNPQAREKVIKYVADYLKKHGLKVKIITKNGYQSLIAATKLKKKYSLILNGHLDVVPATPDQFKPIIKGNRLYGRGTSDMKGPVAVMINTIIQVTQNHPKADIAIILNTDEEVGGFNGVNHLVNNLGYQANCVFIPDTAEGYKLLKAAKGIIHIKVTATGRSSHGSRPWLGDNAITKLISIYQSFDKKFNQATESDQWHTSLNLGKISGGTAANAVPSQAEMHLDIRFPEKFSLQDIRDQINKITSSKQDITWQESAFGDSMHTDPQSPYFKLMQSIVLKYKGFKPEIIKENGGSDGRFFSAKDIPVIMINPKSSQAHIKNEWIDIKDISDFATIVYDFSIKASSSINYSLQQ